MKIKVSASYSGVIATGSYENSRPGYACEIEMELDPKVPIDPAIEGMQKRLQDICYKNFMSDAERQTIEKINKQRQDFHWIPLPDGRLAPSVTSIIGWDQDFFCSPEELGQYAAQGNIIHKQVEQFILTAKWLQPKEIDDCWTDLVILKQGALQLPTEGWDFPGFLKKFPIRDLKVCKQSYNLEHFYGGTPDFEGIPEWSKIKGYEDVPELPTLFDAKRTKTVIKNGKQLAGYKGMVGYEHIKQGAVVELNDKTAQGFSKPEFYSEEKLGGYWKMFLKDRVESFKKRFGV